jgi:selenide, water dikinase
LGCGGHGSALYRLLPRIPGSATVALTSTDDAQPPLAFAAFPDRDHLSKPGRDVATKRLTEFSHGAGCACKLDPAHLTSVVKALQPSGRAELLVGPDTGDDAAVWKLDDGRALVVTADFLTPVVDDPYDWGRVAAANAVSDVYAMGGRPLLALNLVCWNDEELEPEMLAAVLDGAQTVAAAAGFVIAGGHTVTDPEPKYGLAVVGEVSPDRVLTNAGLRPGDALVLSKPLGIGVVTTAIKRGGAPAAVIEAAVASMTKLNAAAAEVAVASGATGATDVTGFGLLGHLGRMALESGVDVRIESPSVPVLDGVRELAEAGFVPGGSARNLRWVDDRLDRGTVDDITVTLLGDAQTSGGLVFGVAPARAADAVAQLRASGHDAAVIGSVLAEPGHGRIHLA